MNWSLKAPPYDTQYCLATHADAQDCTCESLAHLVYFLTGWWVSPRALAIDARVDLPENRNVNHVLSVANSTGLTSYQNCPTPETFTFQSYYQFNTSKLPKQKLNIQLVQADLNISPYWQELDWGTNLPVPTRHLGVGLDDNGNYFDSESGKPIKNINDPSTLGASPAKIVWKSSIKINKKPFMTVAFKQQNDPTYYVQVGSILVPLADPQALNSIGGDLSKVVTLSPEEFALFTVGNNTLFKSNN